MSDQPWHTEWAAAWGDDAPRGRPPSITGEDHEPTPRDAVVGRRLAAWRQRAHRASGIASITDGVELRGVRAAPRAGFLVNLRPGDTVGSNIKGSVVAPTVARLLGIALPTADGRDVLGPSATTVAAGKSGPDGR